MKTEPQHIVGTERLAFDLRIVSLESVHLHEATDPERVQRLSSYLRNDGFLRHPPIAADINGSSVILDGATRTTALRALGCRHALVQVVPYGTGEDGNSINLDAWYHVLPEHTATSVLASIRQMPELVVEESSVEQALELLESADRSALGICAAIVTNRNRALVLRAATPDISIPSVLRSLVRLYGEGGRGEIHRIVQDELIRTVQENAVFPSVVVFPAFTPRDIAECALAGDLLPAGITRHIIPGRALGLNVSLDILQLNASVESKNEWLHEVVRRKVLDKKVRFYDEAVFVFDD